MSDYLKILQNSREVEKLIAVKTGFSAALISNTDNDMRPVITQLIERNCRYFICVGKDSEALHDFVDDCIIEREDYDPNAPIIMTVWMNKADESVGDIAWYFSKNTHISVFPTEYIVALFSNDEYDSQLLEAVRKEFL